jgi:hypothetical protein
LNEHSTTLSDQGEEHDYYLYPVSSRYFGVAEMALKYGLRMAITFISGPCTEKMREPLMFVISNNGFLYDQSKMFMDW